jgi:hypothetical protein
MIDGLRVVRGGLDPKDKVVVNGLMHAYPGAPVQTMTAPMDPRERAAATRAPVKGAPSQGAPPEGSAAGNSPAAGAGRTASDGSKQ